MEDVSDARHQDQHADQAVNDGRNACQKVHRFLYDAAQLRRRFLRQINRRKETDRHTDQDRARRTVNTGQNERQDAELRILIGRCPHLAKEEVHKTDLADRGNPRDDQIYRDHQYAADGYQPQHQKDAVNHRLEAPLVLRFAQLLLFCFM